MISPPSAPLSPSEVSDNMSVGKGKKSIEGGSPVESMPSDAFDFCTCLPHVAGEPMPDLCQYCIKCLENDAADELTQDYNKQDFVSHGCMYACQFCETYRCTGPVVEFGLHPKWHLKHVCSSLICQERLAAEFGLTPSWTGSSSISGNASEHVLTTNAPASDIGHNASQQYHSVSFPTKADNNVGATELPPSASKSPAEDVSYGTPARKEWFLHYLNNNMPDMPDSGVDVPELPSTSHDNYNLSNEACCDASIEVGNE